MRILRLITEKSVEEAMYARARYKLDIDDKVIQAGRFDNKSTQEEQEEFLVRCRGCVCSWTRETHIVTS